MWFERIEKIIILIFAVSAMALIGMQISREYSPVPVSIINEEKPSVVYKVKVTGEVENPGTYTVKEGTRICDVIYGAGGVTNRASVDNLALNAKIIADTDINVPDKYNGDIPSVIKTVNINKADTDTLMLIPGIGNVTAQNIVNYRKINGFFDTTEELMKVDGIGKKKYDQIEKYIITEDINQ